MGIERDAHSGGVALGEEHIDDLLRRAIAEELAEGFLVVADAMALNESDEISRRVAGERGFRKVGVCGEEIVGARVEVGEVAAASAGDEDLFADAVGVVEDEGASAASAGFDGAHESGGSGAEDDYVNGFH
jgi:hypothetical protein